MKFRIKGRLGPEVISFVVCVITLPVKVGQSYSKALKRQDEQHVNSCYSKYFLALCQEQKNCSPTHVEEQPQHKHKIKHDKTTMHSYYSLPLREKTTHHIYSHTYNPP
ncbi:hypothetical protein EVD32_11900 [Bacteroidales bacterium SW299]|nr:hypothetical protein [Bacteroidales bacterium SW299]